MKRRLAIAIALVSRPPILILDEPGTALDIKGRAEISDYLKAYTASGGTVVMTTHIESEIALCSKLYIMKDGVLSPIKNGLSIEEITELI
jgi:ABC-2 type transport system ATP-binding protein